MDIPSNGSDAALPVGMAVGRRQGGEHPLYGHTGCAFIVAFQSGSNVLELQLPRFPGSGER